MICTRVRNFVKDTHHQVLFSEMLIFWIFIYLKGIKRQKKRKRLSISSCLPQMVAIARAGQAESRTGTTSRTSMKLERTRVLEQSLVASQARDQEAVTEARYWDLNWHFNTESSCPNQQFNLQCHSFCPIHMDSNSVYPWEIWKTF